MVLRSVPYESREGVDPTPNTLAGTRAQAEKDPEKSEKHVRTTQKFELYARYVVAGIWHVFLWFGNTAKATG